MRAGLLILGLVVLGAVVAPVRAINPWDPIAIDPAAPLRPPSWRHPCGTDDYGRDILSRVLHGGRRSLAVAGAAVALAAGIGGGLGLLAGTAARSAGPGRWAGAAALYLADVLLAFPVVLLCLALVALLGEGRDGGGLPVLVAAIATVYLAPFIRVGRAAALAVAHEDYVLAARGLGAGPLRLLLRTILPNAASPIVGEAGVRLAQALLTEAGLSFLGLGAQPPEPSWGAMIAEGRRALSLSPWGCVAPGVMLVVTVLGCNLLGDGLRDALDPRRR